MSDITSIAIQSMFQRRAQEQAQQAQFRNQGALAMLQSFLTGIETARTPQEVKKTFSIMNKSFRNFTKEMPGGPLDLLSENDLENVQRLVGQQSSITSELGKVTAEQVAGLMAGRLDFDVAMQNVTNGIQNLGRRFGQEEVTPFTGETYNALIQAMQVRRANEASLNNLRTALAPNIASVLQRRPQLTPLIVDFQQKLDANAKAALMLDRGLQRGDEAELLAHWTVRGNLLNRTGKEVRELGDDEQLAAVDAGQREWLRDVENKKRHLHNRFWQTTLPTVARFAQAEINADIGAMVGMFNQFFTEDDRISPVAYQQFGMDSMFEQLDQKTRTGDATEDDIAVVGTVMAGLRNSGVLDTDTRSFSEMTQLDWESALESGAVDERLEAIKGPGGVTLHDLVFDETGAVHPWAQTVLELDLERLRRGDPLVWDVAQWMVSGADFADFSSSTKRPTDGQPYGAREALLEVAQQSPDNYRKVVGGEVSAFFGGIGEQVAPLMDRLKFDLFGRGGTEDLVERDGRFFEAPFSLYGTIPGQAHKLVTEGREVSGDELRRRQAAQAIFESSQARRAEGGEDAARARARRLDDLERSGDVKGLSQFSSALFADIAPRTDLQELTSQILSQTIGELERGSDLEARAARIRERTSQNLMNSLDDPEAEKDQAVQNNPLAGGAGGRPPVAVSLRSQAADIAKVGEIGSRKVRDLQVPVIPTPPAASGAQAPRGAPLFKPLSGLGGT